MRPYYDDGTVQIWHGTAEDVLPWLEPETVACWVTSPPYNVGIEYDEHNDRMAWPDYWAMAESTCSGVERLLIPGGRAWVNTAVSVPEDGKGQTGDHSGSTDKRRVLLPVEWANRMAASGLHLVDQVSWQSQRGNGTAWGSFESPAAPNLRGDWEAITVACKGSWARTTPDEHKGWKDTEGGWAPMTKTVWKIAPATRDGHPVPYPVEIAMRCIRLSTWPGEMVLDTFVGSGSTLDAARRLGRKAIGIEVSERYCEMAANRIGQGVLL